MKAAITARGLAALIASSGAASADPWKDESGKRGAGVAATATAGSTVRCVAAFRAGICRRPASAGRGIGAFHRDISRRPTAAASPNLPAVGFETPQARHRRHRSNAARRLTQINCLRCGS
jgi:hypothetical protein